MQRFFIQVSLILALCFSIPAWSAEPVVGRDYTLLQPTLPTDNPGKISVTEFFSYQCPHCFAFSRPFSAWKAKLPSDVVCRRESVSIGHPSWEASARAFYALESIGQLDALDTAIFTAIHTKGVALTSEDGIAGWLTKQGVPADKFKAAYRSFGVEVGWKRAQQLAASHKIPSIPTIAIDGKYLVVIASNIDFDKQLSVVDALLRKARAERAAKR